MIHLLSCQTLMMSTGVRFYLSRGDFYETSNNFFKRLFFVVWKCLECPFELTKKEVTKTLTKFEQFVDGLCPNIQLNEVDEAMQVRKMTFSISAHH